MPSSRMVLSKFSHRSYSDGDADLVPGAKSSDSMTINIKYVMNLSL